MSEARGGVSVGRRLENELYELPGVVAARVTEDPDVPLHVTLLLRADAPRAGLQEIVHARAAALGMLGADDEVELRVSIIAAPDGTTGSRPAAGPRGAASIQDRLARDHRRPVLGSVLGVIRGTTFEAEVVLRRGEQTLEGSASGSSASASVDRLIAEAVIQAVEDLHPGLRHSYVEGVSFVQLGARECVAVVVATVAPSLEETLVGAAMVRNHSRMDAIARATLDALNRRLE